MRRARSTKAQRAARLAEAESLCRAYKLPLTRQRRAIYEAVLDLGTHPTADEVLAVAEQRHPGIGRATVYRALESFVRAGVLTKVAHPGAAIRYDAVVAQHHHLVCMHCNAILDIESRRLDALPVPDVGDTGFRIADVQVQLRGTCKDCQKTEETS